MIFGKVIFFSRLEKENSAVAAYANGTYVRPMNLLQDDSVVMTKLRELCEVIAGDSEYKEVLSKVEAFLGNDEARLNYQSVQELGNELNQKQQAGLQLSEQEIEKFEATRTDLLNNPVASSFIEAQQSLETVQTAVSRMVGMTLELGRVPTAEDIQQASSGGGGCCGGSGGGGCGC